MEQLIPPLIVAAFAVGIAVTFLAADRDSPTSRPLVVMFAMIAAILLLSGLRRCEIVPPRLPVWERSMAVMEAVGMLAAFEWVLRVGRTAAPAGAPAPVGERMLRVAQLFVILHGVVGLVFAGIRLQYAHGDWAASVLREPGFWVFLGPLVLACVVGGIRIDRILRSEVDAAERVRLRALGFAGPFILSGIPMTPPWEYVPMAIGEMIFLSGSVRYLMLQARRGQFLERFLSPQVASLVRERGLATAMQQSRVQLSVVACDLRGFTAFAESAAPEEVIHFLREYYDAIGRAVTEYGGTIKDFAGDGVLTLVGAPIAYPDHARRAVALALRIREGAGETLSRWRRLGLSASAWESRAAS